MQLVKSPHGHYFPLTQTDTPETRRTCDCALCDRGRRFYRLTMDLPEADREWMRGLYDRLLDAECEIAMHRAHVSGQPLE